VCVCVCVCVCVHKLICMGAGGKELHWENELSALWLRLLHLYTMHPPILGPTAPYYHTAPRCTILHYTATHSDSLHHTAPHCTTLHHTAIHCNTLHDTVRHRKTLRHTASHCHTLQHNTHHTAPHCKHYTTMWHHKATPQCDTLQHTATPCDTLQQTNPLSPTAQAFMTLETYILQHWYCNTLQHAATRCNTLQHTYPLPPTAQALTQQWQTMHTCMYVCMCPWCVYPPAPMNHVNIFKGCPPRDAPSELVQLGYKKFPPDHIDQVEMKSQLGWVLKPVPHNLVRGIRFWKTKS